MKKFLTIALTTTALALAPLSAMAEGGHGHGGFHGGHGYGGPHYGNGHRGGNWVGPAIIGGSILGIGGAIYADHCYRWVTEDDGYGNLVRHRIYVC
jgi:hypothetical protein